jgi:hypothetical protein
MQKALVKTAMGGLLYASAPSPKFVIPTEVAAATE